MAVLHILQLRCLNRQDPVGTDEEVGTEVLRRTSE